MYQTQKEDGDRGQGPGPWSGGARPAGVKVIPEDTLGSEPQVPTKTLRCQSVKEAQVRDSKISQRS